MAFKNSKDEKFSDQIGGNSAIWHKKIYLISKDEVTRGKWAFTF